jgi:hypothetical protein
MVEFESRPCIRSFVMPEIGRWAEARVSTT